MTGETIVGSIIEAPFNLILREDNELHEILIYKTLEFLFEKNTHSEFTFLIGGKRSSGYGRAVAVKINEKGKYLVKNRNSLGIEKDEADLIDNRFNQLIMELQEKFPIT